MTRSTYPVSAKAWDATNTPNAHLCRNRFRYHRHGRMEAFRFEIADWIESEDVVHGAYVMMPESGRARTYFTIGFQCENAAFAFKMRWSSVETAIELPERDRRFLD